MSARIQNRSQVLQGLSEPDASRRALALDLFEAALADVDPALCTRRALTELRQRGETLDGCTLLAVGKAARGMAEAALAEVDVKHGLVLGFEEGTLGPLTMFAGRHPVPADHAAEHGQQVLALARSLGEGDRALVLISGGGSALLELPVPGVSLADMQATTRALLACGAAIDEVNAVRSALSQLKGGGLARALAPARVFNVVLSDVVGSPLHAIASGPTVQPRPHPDLAALVQRYELEQRLPNQVLRRLKEAHEQPADEDYAHVTTLIAADNLTAQRAMLREAQARGLDAQLHPEPLTGEAREQGRRFVEAARRAGGVYIGGGETTVTLRGQGRGGRNQELVLGAADAVSDGLLASLGTDGIDGACDDAGALVDAVALEGARRHGLDLQAALAANDSNTLVRALGCALHTGRTGTNVTDVCLWLP